MYSPSLQSNLQMEIRMIVFRLCQLLLGSLYIFLPVFFSYLILQIIKQFDTSRQSDYLLTVTDFTYFYYLRRNLWTPPTLHIALYIGMYPVIYTVGLQATFWNMNSNVRAILVVWLGKAAVDSLVDRLSKGGEPKFYHFSS